MALIDQVNSAIKKGTDATTLAAVYIDKISNTANKFGVGKAPPEAVTKPQQDTGIRPIGDFISTIKNVGLAKHNHFTVDFVPPKLMDMYWADNVYSGMGSDTRTLQLLVSSVNLPGVHMNTVQNRTFGEMYETPNEKMYSPLTTTFYVDTEMCVKKIFDEWISYIQNPVSRTFNFRSQFAVDMNITVFDRHGMPHYHCLIKDAYPKGIEDIQLAHDDHNFMKVTVHWAYRNWESSVGSNDIHDMNAPVNTVQSPSMHDKLMGYVGNFKDYQNRFNNLSGDLQRSKQLIKTGDFGGMVGQNFGGGVF